MIRDTCLNSFMTCVKPYSLFLLFFLFYLLILSKSLLSYRFNLKLSRYLFKKSFRLFFISRLDSRHRYPSFRHTYINPLISYPVIKKNLSIFLINPLIEFKIKLRIEVDIYQQSFIRLLIRFLFKNQFTSSPIFFKLFLFFNNRIFTKLLFFFFNIYILLS